MYIIANDTISNTALEDRLEFVKEHLEVNSLMEHKLIFMTPLPFTLILDNIYPVVSVGRSLNTSH